MSTGMRFRVVEVDPDYLGIEIKAWNGRFSGTTFVFAGIHELSEFAAFVSGFPATIPDQRIFEFGSSEPQTAGGFCRLDFKTVNMRGEAILEINLEDDAGRYSTGKAVQTLPIEAQPLDRFLKSLRVVENTQRGEAVL